MTSAAWWPFYQETVKAGCTTASAYSSHLLYFHFSAFPKLVVHHSSRVGSKNRKRATTERNFPQTDPNPRLRSSTSRPSQLKSRFEKQEASDNGAEFSTNRPEPQAAEQYGRRRKSSPFPQVSRRLAGAGALTRECSGSSFNRICTTVLFITREPALHVDEKEHPATAKS